MRIDKSPIFRKQSQASSVLLGRVTRAFIDPADENNKKIFTPLFPGNSGIGAVEFEFITNINNLSRGYAKPLFPQIKYYPLINETIYLIKGPTYSTPEDSNNRELYYVNVFNTFNSSHINPQPITNNGNISNSTELNNDFGKTFNIKKNIQSLLPFEGDNIIEGRWGNSIRFSSAISGSLTSNQWSSGSAGTPVTIIRNGQYFNSSSIDFTLEDINNDASSVYMTNGQQLPINVASKNLDTFDKKLDKVVSRVTIENLSSDIYTNIG